MIELERLLAAVNKRFPTSRGTESVTSQNLREILNEAIHPVTISQDFPRMLYKGPSNRLVSNVKEESAAVREGWSRTPPPQFEEGFPRSYVERPVPHGGTKRCDLRRVTLTSSAELGQFLGATEAEEWIEDDSRNQWGARGVFLHDLVLERKQSLKAEIDSKDLAVGLTASIADTDGFAPPDSGAVRSASKEQS
jgi:hypothetical protein